MLRPFLPLLALVAAPALAQDRVPAPDYFVTTVMETTTAQQLAVNCPTLSVNPQQMAARTEGAVVQLSEDGFTPENLSERMADPSDAIALLQNAFMEQHGLAEGASADAVCAAGHAEIAAASGIGSLLLEVAQ